MCNNANAVLLSQVIDLKHNTIIASKTQGQIYVYNAESHDIVATSALFGKKIGDNVNSKSDKITPSGVFQAEKIFSTHLKENATVFLRQDGVLYAIHPVWRGNPGQARELRLNSPSSTDNRITNGCVNVPKDFYYQHIDTLRNGSTVVIILPENEYVNDDISGPQTVEINPRTAIPVQLNEMSFYEGDPGNDGSQFKF